jgi:hypothetical protein
MTDSNTSRGSGDEVICHIVIEFLGMLRRKCVNDMN